jgi:hypothetical protein
MARPERRLRTLLAALALLPALALGDSRLTLVYSGNLDGELEPCGCTAETDYGGLLRRATYLDGLRANGLDPAVVTTGGLLTAFIGADRIKADFILSGLVALDVDAVGLQWGDLVYGSDFLAAHDLPYVASNWLDGTFAASRPAERAGVRLRFFQWLDPAGSPSRTMQGGHREVGEDAARLADGLATARAAGEVTVLSTTLPLDRARAELPLDHVAVLLVAAAPERPGEPQRLGSTLVLTPGTRGMRLGRVDLEIAADATVASWEASIVELTDKVANAPRLSDWYAAYNDALREDYKRQVAARKARKQGASPYTGAAACRDCHENSTEAWHATGHAGALGILEGLGKAFDPNCVVCHSVGFGKEGGFLAFDETPGLANVQCESCHGPGAAHVATDGESYPGMVDAASACATCHNASHSPSFNYEAYWPRIIHGPD